MIDRSAAAKIVSTVFRQSHQTPEREHRQYCDRSRHRRNLEEFASRPIEAHQFASNDRSEDGPESTYT
jgi:hypothetical protein